VYTTNYTLEQNYRRGGEELGKVRTGNRRKREGTVRRYLLKMNRASRGQQKRESHQGAAAGR